MNPDGAVPLLVQKATAWTWRLLVLGAGVVVLAWTFRQLSLIVVPVAIALLLTALLLPSVDWMDRHGVPRPLAIILPLVFGLAVVGGILAFVVSRLVEGLPPLVDNMAASIDSARRWLIEGPAHLSETQMENIGNSVTEALRNNQSRLTSGVMWTATTLTQFVAGLFVALFTLVVLLHDGRNIYRFVTQIIPASVRDKVRAAGKEGFGALTDFVRATCVVAFIDAVGIGAGLLIMGIPLALPLASLVFLGAFIPFVGAVVTGMLAVLVALISKGVIYALLTLALVIAVQQLEGNVLEPLVMSQVVSIHPLAVVAGVSAGAVLAGIVGALLAVPTIAFLDRAVRALIVSDA